MTVQFGSEKHYALHGDFVELLLEREETCAVSVSLANELVHLVVLHGLLPETSAPEVCGNCRVYEWPGSPDLPARSMVVRCTVHRVRPGALPAPPVVVEVRNVPQDDPFNPPTEAP